MIVDLPVHLGDELLDAEHRAILARVRRLATAAAEGRRDELATSLRFLQGYLGEHFAHEEDWMADVGYPDARAHGRVHAAVLDAFTRERRRAGDDLAGLSRTLSDLVEALEAHMRRDDVDLIRFAGARR